MKNTDTIKRIPTHFSFSYTGRIEGVSLSTLEGVLGPAELLNTSDNKVEFAFAFLFRKHCKMCIYNYKTGPMYLHNLSIEDCKNSEEAYAFRQSIIDKISYWSIYSDDPSLITEFVKEFFPKESFSDITVSF